MNFGKRRRLPNSWTEDEVDSQFPASAFSFEKTPAIIHQTTTLSSFSTSSETDKNNVDRALHEIGGIFSHLPCRVLENWYLVAKPDRAVLGYFASDKSFAFPFRRAPLPLDTQDLENYVLVGTLKSQQPQREGVKLELDNLDFYTIDHQKGYRGYWVITAGAKYWLQKPCSKAWTIPRIKLRLNGHLYDIADHDTDHAMDGVGTTTLSSQLPSQENLHCFHRAQLGLLSNLQDILVLPDGSYNAFFHNLSATQMDEVLTPPSIDVSDFHREREQEQGGNELPTLFKHAFDLELLQSSKFLLPYIRAIDPHVETSRWYKELVLQRNSVEKQEPIGSLQSTGTESRWIKSAIKAESRSRQLPSGALDPEALHRLVDLLYPIELELRYHVSTRTETAIFGVKDDKLDHDEMKMSPLPPLPTIEDKMDASGP